MCTTHHMARSVVTQLVVCVCGNEKWRRRHAIENACQEICREAYISHTGGLFNRISCAPGVKCFTIGMTSRVAMTLAEKGSSYSYNFNFVHRNWYQNPPTCDELLAIVNSRTVNTIKLQMEPICLYSTKGERNRRRF